MDWTQIVPVAQVGLFFVMIGGFLTVLSRERKYHFQMREDMQNHAKFLRENITELSTGLEKCEEREKAAILKAAKMEERVRLLEEEVKILAAAAAHAAGKVEGAKEAAGTMAEFVGKEIGKSMEAMEATAADANEGAD